MINKNQLRELIISVLSECPNQRLNSPEAIDLLMLTAATESKLGTFIRQVRGPAEGIFQMEPATETDIFNNFLKHNKALNEWPLIYTLTRSPHQMSDATRDLVFNLAYQIAMARIHYWRVLAPLPKRSSPTYITDLAEYWKRHYNTPLGKGTVAKAERDFIDMVA